MMLRMFSRSVLGTALCAAAILLTAETPESRAADGASSGRVVKKVRAFKGRLPNYYAEVVTEKQREEIYKIQEEYRPKIEAAKAQLEAITKEQNEKIAAVLTADQKKKIEEAAAAAKAKSKDKPEEKADSTKAEKTPSPNKEGSQPAK